MCLFNFFKKKKNKKKVNYNSWNSNDTIWYDNDYDNDYDDYKNKEHFIDTVTNDSNNQSGNTSLVEDIYMYNNFLNNQNSDFYADNSNIYNNEFNNTDDDNNYNNDDNYYNNDDNYYDYNDW